MKNLILENDDATRKLGQEISEIIKSSNRQNIEIHLRGDLGSGKTFITRSIIKNCGWEDLVKSPTYTLCEEYDLDAFLFLHIDLYRTNEAQDIDIFNLDRVLYKKKIILIEWPERLQLERKYDLKIDFFHLENKRKINITYGTDVFKTLEVNYA
jgi:tRNA threonylcarbamoyladenosine biosynthesis protein TsaE